MKHWQDYVKPNYPGPVDADGFNDTGYFVSIPGVKDFHRELISTGVFFALRGIHHSDFTFTHC